MILIPSEAITQTDNIIDNGILEKAKLARKETDIQGTKEQLEIAIMSVTMNNPMESDKRNYVLDNKEELEKNLTEKVEIYKETKTIKYNNYLFLLKEDCSIDILNQIKIDKENLIMQIIDGKNTEQKINILESNLQGNVMWSSSNTGVAIVDNNGNVTTVGEGETIIKAQVRYIYSNV